MFFRFVLPESAEVPYWNTDRSRFGSDSSSRPQAGKTLANMLYRWLAACPVVALFVPGRLAALSFLNLRLVAPRCSFLRRVRDFAEAPSGARRMHLTSLRF